ncbi:replicative DNA helicase [Kiritimatiella glycovorans]|uniref:Replicative DNA helicase n=1 Tax=Kiritimatiella glycovorans TaxID=1307763 RepID=A0A0G3EHZ6_9BACT|nr:replicative DNA helicase [Kiritimatiella glycovorans]AKJ64430.1 Replicative DNA helicase [Kiritimatiella glycovorans]
MTETSSTASRRVPPHSAEAERGVLGCVLSDAERVISLCQERQVRPESFYTRQHRDLYEELLQMGEEENAVDLLTVVDRLTRNGKLDRLGGQDYLVELIDSTPTSAHAEFYIEILQEQFLRREMIDRARAAVESSYDSEKDATEVLSEVEQSFFELGAEKSSDIVSWPEAVREAVKKIEKIHAEGKPITGISSGFQDIDKLLYGLHNTDVIILAARPSMGKTSLAMNIAEHVALGKRDHSPRPIGVFSLEMSREQLVRRMLFSNARVRMQSMMEGNITRENHRKLMNAADRLQKAEIYIDDSAGLEALELRARARRMKQRYDVQMIVVDYLQLLNYSKYARDGRQQVVAAISGSLKAMAKELDVPVLVLSQLSRAPENRDREAKPRLSDLRESGSIEQDADVVMMLRRPAMYDQGEDETLAELSIEKHRNGPTGLVRLSFYGEFTRFEDRTEQEPEEAVGY